MCNICRCIRQLFCCGNRCPKPGHRDPCDIDPFWPPFIFPEPHRHHHGEERRDERRDERDDRREDGRDDFFR